MKKKKLLLLLPLLILFRAPASAQSGYFVKTTDPRADKVAEEWTKRAALVAVAQFGSALRVYTPLAADPVACSSAYKGLAYFNTVSNVAKVCDGTNWTTLAGATINATNNVLPKRQSATAFTDSSLSDDGTNVKTDEAVAVGFGATAPPSGPMLAVASTVTTSPRGIASMQFNNGTEGARLGFFKARGTVASPTTVVSGDTLGRLMFRGYDGSNYLEMASIEAVTTGTIAATRIPTQLIFQTATNAAPSVLTTALTLDETQKATFAGSILGSGASNTFTNGITLGTSGNLFGGTNVVEQRNTTNAQTLNVYNSTDGTNKEYLSTTFSSNVANITTLKTGTGAQRNLNLGGNGADGFGGIARIKLWTDGTIDFGGTSAQLGTFTPAKVFKIAAITTRGTTEGTNHLDIFDGTAPVGTLTNGISLYSTSGELRVMDAAGISTLISGKQKTRVSSQFDKTNTTLADVTGLSVTVAAGGTYSFRAVLFVDTDVTGGHKYAIAGTATATSIVYQVNSINNATNAFRINSRQTALGGSVGEALGTAYFTTIEGTIVVNAGGTLTVQFAQNAASGTSSVLVNSTFIVEKQ